MKAALKPGFLLNRLAIIPRRGRTDALDLAERKGRLQNVDRVSPASPAFGVRRHKEFLDKHKYIAQLD